MVKITTLNQDILPTGDDYTITLDVGSSSTKKVKLSDLTSLIVNTIPKNTITKRTLVMNEIATTDQTITTTFQNVANWTGTFTSYGGTVYFHTNFTMWRQTVVDINIIRLRIDDLYVTPPDIYGYGTGVSMPINELSSHKLFSTIFTIDNLPAGFHTVKMQARTNSGNVRFDTNDYINMVAIEYVH